MGPFISNLRVVVVGGDILFPLLLFVYAHVGLPSFENCGRMITMMMMMMMMVVMRMSAGHHQPKQNSRWMRSSYQIRIQMT